jgi:hypothetical protein
MKLQPLYDLQQEINRLIIAGSKFVKGDPRLQKFVPILNKLGEKSPIFKKQAVDIEDLLQADSGQAADKLMSVSILLYSILYTQGETVETAEDEEKAQVPAVNIEQINTKHTWSQLKPVIDALTNTYPGRLAIVKDAFERKIFEDSRTRSSLNLALADKYPELCDYVEKTIIPAVGEPMIPLLLQSFRYEDKTEQIRRLRLLYKLGYPGISSIINEILTRSMPSLEAAAIEILGDNLQNEDLIIRLADDKNKTIREAAYRALAKLDSKESLSKLTDAYLKNKNKTNLPLIVNALTSSKLPFFFQEIFNQVVHSFEEFLKLNLQTDEKVLTEMLENFATNLETLKNKNDERIYQFISQIVENESCRKLISSKKNLLERFHIDITNTVLAILKSFDTKKQLEFFEKHIKNSPNDDLKVGYQPHYFLTAANEYSKEDIFNIFSPLFKKNVIHLNTMNSVYGIYNTDNDEVMYCADKLDKRWLEVLYGFFEGKGKNFNFHLETALNMIAAIEKKKDESAQNKGSALSNLIKVFDKKNDDRFNQLLIDLAGRLQHSDKPAVIRLMMEHEVPKRFEIIYSILEQLPKNTYYWTFNHLKNRNIWNQFPKEYEVKFRELYKKNPLSLFEDIANEIMEKRVG